MRKWKARVRIGSRPPTEVRIEAATSNDAKRLLEAQYGAGSVVSSVEEVR